MGEDWEDGWVRTGKREDEFSVGDDYSMMGVSG